MHMQTPMQGLAQAPSPDEVDAETLQALLVHFSPASRPTLDSDAAQTTDATTRSNEAPTRATLSDPFTSAEQLGVAFDDAASTRDAIPLFALPDAQYLERTILPLLLRGLEEVALARPPDPLAFLGAYLVSNNPRQPAAGLVGLAPPLVSLLPTEQPAIAEAVQRAVERFAPPVKGAR